MYSVEGLNQGFTKGQFAAGCILGQCFMVGVLCLVAKLIGIAIGLGQAGLISLAMTGTGILCGILYYVARGIARVLIWLICQGASVWIIKAILGIVLTKAALIWGICYLLGLAVLGLVVLVSSALIINQSGNDIYSGRLFDFKQRVDF